VFGYKQMGKGVELGIGYERISIKMKTNIRLTSRAIRMIISSTPFCRIPRESTAMGLLESHTLALQYGVIDRTGKLRQSFLG